MTALGAFSSGDVLTAADLNAIGTWTTFTPNISTSVGTLTTVAVDESVYCVINDVVLISLIYKITNVGTGLGTLVFDLPVNTRFSASFGGNAIGVGRENQLNGKTVNVFAGATDKGGVSYYDNTSVVAVNHGAGLFCVYKGI